MYEILSKQKLVPKIHLLKIREPILAKKSKPGQFVVLKIDEEGERIPLNIADWDENAGSIDFVIFEKGATTLKLASLKQGDSLVSLAGPLGLPTQIEKFGHVVCLAAGVAAGFIIPIAKAMKQKGNKVTSLIWQKNKKMVFWEDRLAEASDRLIIATEDGSYGQKGPAPVLLKKMLENGEKIDRVNAMGPGPMLKACSDITRPFGIKTIVSLHSIMVDGIGMCGSCRVSVGGKTKFACVDGPDFDGHQVDWKLFSARNSLYKDEEKIAIEQHFS
ncbi:MAG: sulfide/dihydroorotate dehydrogenase-like FAD/NAD-binding protein [Candidatus Aminicenantes bacterium]